MALNKSAEELNKKIDFNDSWDYEKEKNICYSIGLKNGIEFGMEIGTQRKNYEIAKRMCIKKIDISLISDITGFSEEEIKKFINTWYLRS